MIDSVLRNPLNALKYGDIAAKIKGEKERFLLPKRQL
jgi:hypothetical protein